MIDPASLTALTGLIIKGLELVQKKREGNLNEDDARSLYCKIYASLLWEIYENLERCKMIYKNAEEKGQISAGILSFFVRDALFSDFCIMCPEPLVIKEFNSIYGAFERVHHWQRMTSNLQSESSNFIIAFAKSIFSDRQADKTYDLLRESLIGINSEINIPPKFVNA